MNINQFVFKNNLKPADAIILNKKFMGMVDHFVIYIGHDDNEPKFVANFNKGIKVLPNNEINKQLKKYLPNRIERCPGNDYNREEAVKRALSRLGEKAYGYFSNNCEHFKNWVHYGKNISKQVNTAGNVTAILGAGLTIGGAATSNGKTMVKGVGLLTLGLILKGLSER